MKTRPKSLTVVCWYLIVSGVWGFVGLLIARGYMNDPKTTETLEKLSHLPLYVQYGMGAITLIVSLVSGISMLRGKNWARVLYVSWHVIAMAISFAASPNKVIFIPGTILFIVILFFLFNAKANRYFSDFKETSNDTKNI